jgi:DNA-binding transcriptional LysR family regulator
MDFAALRAFAAVAQHGTFSAAAETLHLSQPGVTRQVQRLERELGVALLERGGGANRLTVSGEQVLRWAEETLARQDLLRAQLRGEACALRGDLKIAASTTPGEFLAPELVAGFVQTHPEVRPHVAIADSAAVENAVRERRCDLGFVGAELAGRGLRYRPVLEDEVVLAVGVDHPFARRADIDLAELTDQPFVVREGGSGTAACVDRALAARGLIHPGVHTVMTLGSSTAIVTAAERGLGIGWVSSLALHCRGQDRVVPVRLRGIPIRRVLSLVDDPRRTPSAVAAAFAAWVGDWQPAPCVDDPRGLRP